MIQLPIPIAALADCGTILGRRGAGKSGAGRALLEHELDVGHRCCVIDPKGDWYGIRAYKDGTPSRFEIPVFGGAHPDLPIDDTMGAALGEIVATSSSSCVIDLSGFSVAGMRRFMTAFAEALFFHNKNPLTLFVDEADQLAPQRVAADQARLLHNMEMLIRQGRQRGIFMWMLTQRPAVINKNLLSQAETLIAMKMTGPQDRKAIRDWMDAHDPERAAMVEADLAKLTVGQAWAWVPSADFLERVQFPLFETFDSGRTPQHGEVVSNVQLKPLDVAAIAAALTKDDEHGEEAEVDRLRGLVTRLRARIVELDERDARRVVEGDRLLAVLTGVQDLIGAAVGSARIEPLAPGASFEDFVMLIDADDVIRPFPRQPGPGRKIQGARRRMADALPVESEKQAAAPVIPDELARHAIATIMDSRLLDKIKGDVPAIRRIVAAVAFSGFLSRDAIPALAGVSPTSSHVGVGLKKLVQRGILDRTGDTFSIAKVRP